MKICPKTTQPCDYTGCYTFGYCPLLPPPTANNAVTPIFQDKPEAETDIIAQILRDNITFSGQIGTYVIHGAIEKIAEYFENKHSQELNAFKEKLIKKIETKIENFDTEHYMAPEERAQLMVWEEVLELINKL